MMHKKFESILPYMDENFITYPLWEEGLYIPFVNFWQIVDREEDHKPIQDWANSINKEGQYAVVWDDVKRGVLTLSIFPDFDYRDDGSYFFRKEDWSIEEMVEIIESFINKN